MRFAVSGGMYDREAVYAVRKRGILMEQAVPDGEGAMAAVLGMSGDQVEHVLNARENVFVANYNCPGQIMITGKKDAVLQAGEALLSHGAKRVLPLKVSGPFHSPFLQEAGNRLEETLREILWKELRIPYITNVTAAPVLETDKIQELLVRQVASPVRWQQSMERMIDGGGRYVCQDGPEIHCGAF